MIFPEKKKMISENSGNWCRFSDMFNTFVSLSCLTSSQIYYFLINQPTLSKFVLFMCIYSYNRQLFHYIYISIRFNTFTYLEIFFVELIYIYNILISKISTPNSQLTFDLTRNVLQIPTMLWTQSHFKFWDAQCLFCF